MAIIDDLIKQIKDESLRKRIQAEQIAGGEKYSDHLFVNDEGFAKIKLNDWEKGVLELSLIHI